MPCSRSQLMLVPTLLELHGQPVGTSHGIDVAVTQPACCSLICHTNHEWFNQLLAENVCKRKCSYSCFY